MRIVPRMIRITSAIALTLLVSASAFAQTSQFGILLGGSKRLISSSDEASGVGVSDNFKFGNSVREIYYSIDIEPGTRFKIKAGKIEGPVAFRIADVRNDLEKGTIEHVDGLIDYRFSEAFGSTGIFAGAGLYRQKGRFGDTQETETNYGFSGGVNADFPISRRIGFIAEASYHWVNFAYRPRYITLSGGLRFSF